jgi:hypothetical protein
MTIATRYLAADAVAAAIVFRKLRAIRLRRSSSHNPEGQM